LPLAEEFVAVFYDLMSTTHQIDIVTVGEFLDNILTKSEADTSIVLTPVIDILVRVRPEQIA